MTHNPLSARDEENRRLAEFIGCEFRLARLPDDFPKTAILFWFMPNGDFVGENPPDFYADEAANALLLEDMPGVMLQHWEPGEWLCSYDRRPPSRISYKDADRKTAVVKACLRLINDTH